MLLDASNTSLEATSEQVPVNFLEIPSGFLKTLDDRDLKSNMSYDRTILVLGKSLNTLIEHGRGVPWLELTQKRSGKESRFQRAE